MYLIIYVEALKSSINGENIAVTFFCFRYCFGCKNVLLPSRHLYEEGGRVVHIVRMVAT